MVRLVEPMPPTDRSKPRAVRLREIYCWFRTYTTMSVWEAARIAQKAVVIEYTDFDIKVSGRGGTLLSFEILTEDGRSWVNRFVELESYQYLGDDTFVVEHRYADPIIEGMVESGLKVLEV